ncbi:DNA gyrase, A subunit, partial [Candidatus Arthromitus sp. SFB-4]
RDESDREGIRVVIELKKDVNANIILNQLYKLTKLQDTFGVIMLSLVDNEPKILNLKDILIHYLNYQKEVVTRRSKFDLKKAENNKHILEGYKIALDNIDEIIKIIRESNNNEIAKQSLIDRFKLTEIQALSILEMRLRRLTALERDKIESELLEKMNLIKELKEILDNERSLLNLIKDELLEIKSIHNTDRRTYIDKTYYEDDINKDNLIHREDIVVTLTHDGYIKRMASNTYSSQKRGGRGMQAMTVKENDFIENIFHTTTHHNLLFFTNLGRVYNIKAYEIPDSSRTAKGINIINLINLNSNEKVQVFYV